MKRELQRWMLYLLMAGCLVGLLWQTLQQPDTAGQQEPGERHFAVLVPQSDSANSNVEEVVEQMAREYRLDLELHAFSAVAEQKQMLRLLAKTDVDGVVLWPISASDADYSAEIQALRGADIPVVVMERDVARGARNSFVGSGTTSDLLVLEQSLQALDNPNRFVVGNQSGSGSSQVVEMLVFQRNRFSSDAGGQTQDNKLRQLAANPPEGYQAVDYLRLEGEETRSLTVKYTLVALFSGDDAPGLFFSLDEALSDTAISAKQSDPLSAARDVMLLCYGERTEHTEYLDNGILDGLVTSRPGVSAYIAIRYLRDLCRDFWVPAAMDSGIDLLTKSVE